ncbi:MAG: DUF5674 family protein [Candidatus Dependentiae bacterium]
MNLFPDHYGTDEFIVFDSMINLRPSAGNRSRNVEDPVIQEKIKKIVANLKPVYGFFRLGNKIG